jgi:hypothetical protein
MVQEERIKEAIIIGTRNGAWQVSDIVDLVSYFG